MKIKDPTGVGDAYRSGFITGYFKGLDWELCGKMGALASTYVLEQVGTQSHAYTGRNSSIASDYLWDDQGKLDILLLK
jgi:adenosine kinase